MSAFVFFISPYQTDKPRSMVFIIPMYFVTSWGFGFFTFGSGLAFWAGTLEKFSP